MTDTATSELDLQRRYWRLAAILFIGGGLGAIPSDALHEPSHPSTIYLLPALAIVSGIVCWVIADHVSRGWLHVMTVIATLEIAITVWLADETFAIYYTFIAIFAAYVFRSRRAVALHVAFASLCALAPMVYEPGAARETLEQTMALIPTLLLAAGAVVFLRERLEASEERFRRLSERDPLTGAATTGCWPSCCRASSAATSVTGTRWPWCSSTSTTSSGSTTTTATSSATACSKRSRRPLRGPRGGATSSSATAATSSP